MALTSAQMAILAAALRAETNAGVVAAMTIRNDVFLNGWCNASSSVDMWHEACSGNELFEAMDVSKFDNLTAGKRDVWRLMLDFAPIDMRKAQNRKAVIDAWASTAGKPGDDSLTILPKCFRKATNAELYLGAPVDATTSNGITAKKLSFVGNIDQTEMSVALNRNP